MKNYLLWWLLALWISIPLIANAAPNWWVLWSSISSSNWIENKWCTSVLDSSSCDYTGPSKALRLGYEYEFADEFWAWSQDRKLKNACTRFQEQWNYNRWEDPSFWRTDEVANNVKDWVGYWVFKNTSNVVLKADRIYQIKDVPESRSSSNMLVKYVIEYANDKAATTRYQHTECYPYEISRCGDGVVDKDWFRKAANDPGEECDYNDPNKTWWKDGSGKTCNQACKLVDVTPECNNTYNGKIEYTSSSNQRLKSTDNLCKEWSVTEFTYSGTPRTYTWKCQNGKTNVPC